MRREGERRNGAGRGGGGGGNVRQKGRRDTEASGDRRADAERRGGERGEEMKVVSTTDVNVHT